MAVAMCDNCGDFFDDDYNPGQETEIGFTCEDCVVQCVCVTCNAWDETGVDDNGDCGSCVKKTKPSEGL